MSCVVPGKHPMLLSLPEMEENLESRFSKSEGGPMEGVASVTVAQSLERRRSSGLNSSEEENSLAIVFDTVGGQTGVVKVIVLSHRLIFAFVSFKKSTPNITSTELLSSIWKV